MSEVSNAAPDLSHLPYETRVSIAVAETQGARWNAEGELWLSEIPVVLSEEAASSRTPYATVLLPDWPNEPAAWGALMEKELAGVRQIGPGAGWFGVWWTVEPKIGPRTLRAPESAARTIGEAVCLAVLAKHGRTVEP